MQLQQRVPRAPRGGAGRLGRRGGSPVSVCIHPAAGSRAAGPTWSSGSGHGALGWSWGAAREGKARAPGRPPSGETPVPRPAAVTPGNGVRARPARVRGGEGAGTRGGSGAQARTPRKPPRSVTRSERQRPGQAQGRERGPGGSAPPHRGAHGGRGLSTARQAQPPPARPGRALSNSRGRLARSRKPSSSFFFSCYCSCCPRPTAAAHRGRRQAESGWRPAGRTERGRPATPPR